jgi:hypothetical protein
MTICAKWRKYHRAVRGIWRARTKALAAMEDAFPTGKIVTYQSGRYTVTVGIMGHTGRHDRIKVRGRAGRTFEIDPFRINAP